ncbi:hypothetical protein MCEMSE15_02536 [Fimbriimonadaceae bacterium]
MRLEPTFDQRLGRRLCELGVLVLAFLAFGMWIVWLIKIRWRLMYFLWLFSNVQARQS